MANSRKPRSSSDATQDSKLNPFLVALGQRVRALRDRSGTTRKALSLATGVSERHLANLEYGEGNVSVLVLEQVASALHCPVAELIGDFTTTSPEWLTIRSLLENRNEQALYQARIAISKTLETLADDDSNGVRIALIGLRGAGKTTLGKMLAEELDLPFVELSREIEKLAGCSIAELQDLYGAKAYRRYERRALEEAARLYPNAVIATPGGLVSDAANFNLLLSLCTTIWLQANPQDHMQRVIEQGDFRPMAGNVEAMDDLKNILAARAVFYSRAGFSLDTSAQSLQSTFAKLSELVRDQHELENHIMNAV